MNLILRIAAVCSVFLFTHLSNSQQNDSSAYPITTSNDEFKKIIPEKDFDAGWMHSVIFGSHWRDLWTAPINVPVLNLNDLHGGLEILPGEQKGGKQSKVLKFIAKDGTILKFRSTLKFAKFAIDPELKGTLAEYIIQDQVSIKHPYAPIIAFNLLKAADVMMPEPKMYVLPDDPKLNLYNDYKNLLGTVQEVPGGDKKTFNGFSRIIKTEKLLKKMNKNSETKVDGAGFLKARLMDIFMSDWDRHHKQWLWAGDDSLKIWTPVSQDRDEAFCRYDGLMPWLFAEAVPRFEGISGDYPLIDFITWEGRYLDRKFLTDLTKTQWDSVTQFLNSRLSNNVIHNAVSTMPHDWYKLSGRKLENILSSRRDKIKEISGDYYELIFHEPDIWASDKNETAQIDISGDDNITVKINREGSDKPFYERTFDAETTSEVRIYLQGGNDKVILTGNNSSSIKVRVIGGEGEDMVEDRSSLTGGSVNLIFYDDGRNTAIKETDNVSLNNDKYKMLKDVIQKIDPVPQDYGSLLTFLPALNFNTDEGFIFGGASFFTRYGFRYSKFKYRLTMNGTYSTKTRGYFFKFTSDFNGLIKNTGVGFYGELSGAKFSNFYGMGNETTLDKDLQRNNYYRVEQNKAQVGQLFSFRLADGVSFNIGGTFKNISIVNNINTLVGDRFSAQTGRVNYLGFNSALEYEEFVPGFSPRNTYGRLSVTHFPDIFKTGYKFTKTKFEFSRILLRDFMKRSFFTFEVKGEKIFGNFPFYESALLGGSTGLRGFSKDRFSGDASLSGKLDADIYLFSTEILLPADVSMLIISDAGRVFNKGERSNKVHFSYGGGLNFGYFKRLFNLQVLGANSVEGAKFYFNAILHF
jgi:hypothetical protein